MSVSVEICPLTDTLEMYGQPDTSSAYSLSGHVAVKLSSPFSYFDHRRTAHFLLRSLVLTFEGQTEIFTPQTGYSGMRLCSITKELAPEEPLELSNEGLEEGDQPCVWNVVFDLAIPGWLPATITYGQENIGVHYSLRAEAKFENMDEDPPNTWSFAALCTSFQSKVKNVLSSKTIVLKRFASEESRRIPYVTFMIDTLASSVSESSKDRIPADVLSNIQVLASVPEDVDVNASEIPVTLRMRTQNLDAADCERVQVSSVSVDVLQIEKSRVRPTPDYRTLFPLPGPSQQPPNMPLRRPHPLSAIYDVGLFICEPSIESCVRCFSLLPPGETGLHHLGENHPFAKDALPEETPTWYTLETLVPLVRCAEPRQGDEWAGPSILHPSTISPLLNIRHEARISLTFSYKYPRTGVTRSEELIFAVPVRFAPFPPPPVYTPPLVRSPEPDAMSEQSTAPSSPTMPYAPNLPAYSQLFDSNGERKIDYSIPLPLYTPASSSSTLELDVQRMEQEGLGPTSLESHV